MALWALGSGDTAQTPPHARIGSRARWSASQKDFGTPRGMTASQNLGMTFQGSKYLNSTHFGVESTEI